MKKLLTIAAAVPVRGCNSYFLRFKAMQHVRKELLRQVFIQKRRGSSLRLMLQKVF